MSEGFDIAIIGGGAAGMTAATTARKHAAGVIVFDEQSAPGGQMYRSITQPPVRRREVLGIDYWRGTSIVEPFRASGATYLPGTTVWAIARSDDGGFDLAVSAGRHSVRHAETFRARALILAPGAIERPFPIPGGTLPGVMTAGAAQLMLKSAGLRVQGRTVLAGLGPLLWLTAWQQINAGGSIDLLLETIPRGRLAEAMRHAPGFMFSAYLAKGLELVRRVRRRVRVVEHVEAIRAVGSTRVESVQYVAHGRRQSVDAELLLVHQGIVPDVHIAAALGCKLRWHPTMDTFEPVVDDWGASSVPGVFIAGDAAGIAGAVAAETRGRIAALAALHWMGRIETVARDEAAIPERLRLANAMRGRAFLDALYRAPDAFRVPADDETIVCRCEEVSAGALRAAVRAGATGVALAQASSRCGMGPCQGRQCALTMIEVIARERAVSPAEIGHPRMHFPTKPVTPAELAAWHSAGAAERAVH